MKIQRLVFFSKKINHLNYQKQMDIKLIHNNTLYLIIERNSRFKMLFQ